MYLFYYSHINSRKKIQSITDIYTQIKCNTVSLGGFCVTVVRTYTYIWICIQVRSTLNDQVIS